MVTQVSPALHHCGLPLLSLSPLITPPLTHTHTRTHTQNTHTHTVTHTHTRRMPHLHCPTAASPSSACHHRPSRHSSASQTTCFRAFPRLSSCGKDNAGGGVCLAPKIMLQGFEALWRPYTTPPRAVSQTAPASGHSRGSASERPTGQAKGGECCEPDSSKLVGVLVI